MENSESSASVLKACIKSEKAQTKEFIYKLRSKGASYQLKVPLTLPYTGNVRELAVRLVNAHKLPCYLEDDLCSQLQRFGREETLKLLDQEAEENLYGGSVLEEGSETEQSIGKWVDCFTENNVEFAAPADTKGTKDDIAFSEIYHKLIHSPALETLLQLEHTYALAVSEVCKARDNAREIMQKRHDTELSAAMKLLGSQSSEADINTMMRQHTAEREQSESMWSSELSQLQESQRREYREWVLKVHEDTTEKEKGNSSSSQGRRKQVVSEPLPSVPPTEANDSVFMTEAEPPPLEESFTIHLGAQKKTMHNVRVICGDPLNLCRHKHGHTHPAASPERLLTAMSLYSSKLSALVLMVDGRVNSLGGIKEAFADVCHQSTDFHFHDIDVQLSMIQECAVIGNGERRERKLGSSSLSSQASDSQISRGASPLSFTSPDRNSSVSLGMTSNHTHPSSNSAHQLSPDTDPGMSTGTSSVSWTLGGQGEPGNGESRSSSLLDTTSVSLEPGDFYVTRHSNLSNVHIVLHLVTEEAAIQSTSLKSRHPVVLGLKNCLRTAARHDVHHITLPLLLVHDMQPEMTINWCLKRAELIFKCVKGFMLENSTWGDGDSRTIQFLVPSGISKDLFEEFCEMLPRVFRIMSSRNLTSRTRGYSYKT